MDDLHAIDPSFKDDGRTAALIETLIAARPRSEINASFRAALKKRLAAKAAETPAVHHFLSTHRGVLSAAAILLVVIVSAPVITVLMRDRHAFSAEERSPKADAYSTEKPSTIPPSPKKKEDTVSTADQARSMGPEGTVKQKKSLGEAKDTPRETSRDDLIADKRDEDTKERSRMYGAAREEKRSEEERADRSVLAGPATSVTRKSATGMAAPASTAPISTDKGENPFVSSPRISIFTVGPRSTALNTLSQYLKAKLIPPQYAVRAEGLINSAGYADDIPALSITHTVCPWNSAHSLLVFTVRGAGEASVSFSDAVREYRLIANGNSIPSGPNATIAVYEIAAVPGNEALFARASFGTPEKIALTGQVTTPLTQSPAYVRYAVVLAEFGLLVSGSRYKGTADYDHAIRLAEEMHAPESIVSLIQLTKAAAER